MVSTRFTSFPLTLPPPAFVTSLVDAFVRAESTIATSTSSGTGLNSDEVLAEVRPALEAAGWNVEKSKKKDELLQRPVFFGENGVPAVSYNVDAFHPGERCGLEVEAGRSILGNAVQRDLISALVMVDVDHLALAVPNYYTYKSKDKAIQTRPYETAHALASTLYGHQRFTFPYGLILIGY